MSYIRHSLGQSEAVIYCARFPWFYHAGGWAALVVLIVVGTIVYAGSILLLFGKGWTRSLVRS